MLVDTIKVGIVMTQEDGVLGKWKKWQASTEEVVLQNDKGLGGCGYVEYGMLVKVFQMYVRF